MLFNKSNKSNTYSSLKTTTVCQMITLTTNLTGVRQAQFMSKENDKSNNQSNMLDERSVR